MIVTRVLPIFPNSTFMIMKSCSKPTAEKHGKIWLLVAQWGGWGGSVGASSSWGFRMVSGV